MLTDVYSDTSQSGVDGLRPVCDGRLFVHVRTDYMADELGVTQLRSGGGRGVGP